MPLLVLATIQIANLVTKMPSTTTREATSTATTIIIAIAIVTHAIATTSGSMQRIVTSASHLEDLFGKVHNSIFYYNICIKAKLNTMLLHIFFTHHVMSE